MEICFEYRLNTVNTCSSARLNTFILLNLRTNVALIQCRLVLLFVCVDALRPSQYFVSHVGRFFSCLPRLNCLAQGLNIVLPVGLEPATAQSQVLHSSILMFTKIRLFHGK